MFYQEATVFWNTLYKLDSTFPKSAIQIKFNRNNPQKGVLQYFKASLDTFVEHFTLMISSKTLIKNLI